MWRLMPTWGMILELLNNQSQTSHHINADIKPGTVEQSVVNILTSVDDVEINHSADVENDPGTVK